MMNWIRSNEVGRSWSAAGLVLALASAQQLEAGYVQEVLADNPVGYWRFEETTGTTAVDSSGGGRDGTYQPGVTLGAAGAAMIGGNSATFDGSTGFVDLPGTWGGVAEVTVEAWVKSAGITGDFQSIISGHNPNAFVHFQLHSAGNTGIYTDAGFQGTPIISAEPIGEWRHVAIVAQPGNSRVFVNGVQFGDAVTGNFATVNTSENVDIGIGHVSTRWFNGDIDEVAIYNTALSDARLLAHYNAGVPEPSSIVLFAFGVLGLVHRLGRKKNGQ